MPIIITKSTGEREPLNLEKVKRGCERAGASSQLCALVAGEVEKQAREGMSTKEIYGIVQQILNKEHPPVAARLNLRDAIIKLGPIGYDFEKYIARVLAEYGYKTELPPILQGACVTHEVDVLATKDSRTAMIECKLRHEVGIFISIKDTMSTWARFLDLVDGSAIGKCPHLEECWLVTNSRFSRDSIQYGHCKNMVMLSWDHPKERPLPAWIDDKGLYPITMLAHLSPDAQKRLISAGLVLLHDLAAADPEVLAKKSGVPIAVVKQCVAEAGLILQR
ncbi:ATPase [Candidatus Uhrbacteria bacterium]|nr:ATPase [Candidatus Uhrbacteria bacterium]